MYEKFYGFKEKPFNMTPDSKFFYPSPKHEEALNCILLAISQRSGFVVITGDIGSGKTTVCRTVISNLNGATKTALILNTHLNRKELLTTILEDFGIDYRSTSKTHLLSALNKFLIEQASKDNNVVLIIDEAQNLTPLLLEEIRMLSNLETEKEKLIQIIVMGQPELKEKLFHPKLEQFNQRVVLYHHIEPLNLYETELYIRHRLKMAGYEKDALFSQDSIFEIYKYSNGVPRLINLACHNALISGLLREATHISGDIALEAVRELTQGLVHSPFKRGERIWEKLLRH